MKKLNVISICTMFMFFIAFPAFASCLTDTGQTKCYDEAGAEITCPQPGQEYHGQDANYNPAETQMSYTSLAGGTMVQDNVTGLIWEVKTDDGTIHDKDNRYTWQNAQDVFIAGLNAENFGGYSDWRLPAREELRSLVDYSISYSSGEPTINKEYFPNTQRSYYWSSSTYAYITNDAWYVGFNNGSDVRH